MAMKQETITGVWGGQHPTMPRLGGRGGSVTLRCVSLSRAHTAVGTTGWQLPAAGSQSTGSCLSLRQPPAELCGWDQQTSTTLHSAGGGDGAKYATLSASPAAPRGVCVGGTGASLTRGLGSAWEKM